MQAQELCLLLGQRNRPEPNRTLQPSLADLHPKVESQSQPADLVTANQCCSKLWSCRVSCHHHVIAVVEFTDTFILAAARNRLGQRGMGCFEVLELSSCAGVSPGGQGLC